VKGFLIDENLPDRLRLKLPLPAIPGDEAIWEFARLHELAIITKDADFTERAMLGRPPPWVVHLRIGNLRRKQFEDFLSHNMPKILAYLPRTKLVSVYADRIEAVS